MRSLCLLMILSTLYTSLPHNLIREKLISLIAKTFARENKAYIACNEHRAFLYMVLKIIILYLLVQDSSSSLHIYWIIFMSDLVPLLINK